MFHFFFLVFLAGVSHGAKLVEQREIKTSSGNTFNCFYTINYNARGVNKKKSSVTCDPNENGGTAIEEIDQSFANKTFFVSQIILRNIFRLSL